MPARRWKRTGGFISDIDIDRRRHEKGMEDGPLTGPELRRARSSFRNLRDQ